MCKLHHKATTERIFGDFTKTITKSDVHQKELQTKTLNLDEMVEMVESCNHKDCELRKES